MLFKRYADPFPLMNGLIRTARFEEFILEFIKIHNEETEEETLWEFFLHKIYGKTYQEFVNEMKTKDVAPSEEDIQKTISDSYETLKGFSPF